MSYVLPIIFILILVAIVAFIASKFQKLKVFFEEVSFEMSKVTWPNRNDVINSTIIVGIATVVLTLVVMVVDTVIGKMVYWLF